MTEKRPEFRPGNPEIFWYIRDHCHWPMTAKVMYEAMYKRWGGRELFPSDSLLAKDTGSSPTTVKRWRKWLRTHNLLEWTTDKAGATNNYRLLPPWNYLGQNDPGQNYLGQIDPGYSGDLGQDNLGQNNLGHGDRGDLGQIGLQRRKGEEEKVRDTDTAAAINTSHLGETNGDRDNLRGGYGGRNDWSNIPKEWLTVVPPLPEWNGVLECKRALNDVLRELEAAELSRGPVAQQDEEGRPYAVILQKFKPAAEEKGRPLQWWIHQAGIAALIRETWFDEKSLRADMARIARGEVINLGVPEWASLTDYRDSLEGHGFWEAGLDTDYWAGIGVGLVTDPAGMLDIMRWTAVNKVARAHQSTAEYDAIRDALLRAEESGAGLEDDPEAMRFRLVGARPDAGAMLGLNRDLVEQILSKSYRLAVRPIRGDYADTYHFRLWRTTLIGALEKGDLQLAEDLIDRNQEAAANLSEQRGWAKLYPAAVQMFETLQKVYL